MKTSEKQILNKIKLKKNKITYSLLFLLSGSLHLIAQTAVKYDSVQRTLRKLPQKTSKVYTGKEFDYTEKVPEPNVFEKFLQWIYFQIGKLLKKIFNLDIKTPNPSHLLYNTLFFLLIVIVIILLIFFFIRLKKNMGRNDEKSINVDEIEKNIHETDFDKLIANAYTNQNYRLAIRFYYLKMLQILSEKELIEYRYQKTNYEYFYELKNETLKPKFQEVSNVFDYSWYGDFSLSETDYITAKNMFEDIQNLLEKTF